MSDVRTEEAPAASTRSRSEDHGSYIWYELMTTDPQGAKAFYDSVVGWNIGEPMPGPVEYRMIRRSDGGNAGGVLTLTDDMQQHGARPTWLGYICVDQVDEAVASIDSAGGNTLMRASDIPDVGRIAMVADPQGAPFYVMKPKPPEPKAKSDVFSPEAQQRCSWNELSTSDPVAARRFYTEQFGWTGDEFLAMPDGQEYRFLDHQGQRIGAIGPCMDGQQSHWRYYFRVASIAAAKQAVETKGGKIALEPMQVPTGDYIIIGLDPQGAEFALVGGA